MGEPRITTVIPTYRRPRLLMRAIQSALAQSYPDIRVSVHDNDSGDETESVVRELMRDDPRITYTCNDENIGGLRNIAGSLGEVETELYSLLSDDDCLLPGFYERAVRAFDANPSLGFVCSRTVIVDVDRMKANFRNRDWEPGIYEPSPDVVQRVAQSHFTSTGILFTRRLRDRIGSFEGSGDDRLYACMAAAASPFAVLAEYGALHVLHSEAFTRTSGLRRADMDIVAEHFLATVERISGLEIAPDTKFRLLLIVHDAYRASFDAEAWASALETGESAGAGPYVEPQQTRTGLYYGLLDRVPRPLRGLARRALVEANRLTHRYAPARGSAAWGEVPEGLGPALANHPMTTESLAEVLRSLEV